MPYFLGVDAGGTKTEFLLGDETRILSRVRTGTIKRMRANEAVTEANLLGHRDHAGVRGRDHVVEAVDLVTAEVHRPGQAAETGAALDHGYLGAGLGQAQSERGAEHPAADDADLGRLWAHPGCATGCGSAAAVAAAGATSTTGRGAVTSANGDTGGGWMRPTICAAITRK